MVRTAARRLLPALALALSCAAPSELARRSEVALAAGDRDEAFELATRALDREPANGRAKAAARSAYEAIAGDWMRRIRAVADADTLAAASQVLELAGFRARAMRYVDASPDSAWRSDERALRRGAARVWYDRGVAAADGGRPKKAYAAFVETERYVAGFRDVADRMALVLERARTRVAVLPLSGTSTSAGLGVRISAHWRDELAQRLTGGEVRFTRVIRGEEVERVMTVSELGRLTREDAIRIGRRVGAARVVWGTLGGVRSDTRTDRFDDVIARRVVEKDAHGDPVVRWTDVPIDVIARERTVSVDVEVQILSTDEETTLAARDLGRSLTARTVWTAFRPEGDLDAYALVPEPARDGDPGRVRRVETRWKAVAGPGMGLKKLLGTARAERSGGHYRREVLPHFYSGGPDPVFLDDVPPVEDLAFAAMVKGWEAVLEDLRRLDPIDDLDLEAAR